MHLVLQALTLAEWDTFVLREVPSRAFPCGAGIEVSTLRRVTGRGSNKGSADLRPRVRFCVQSDRQIPSFASRPQALGRARGLGKSELIDELDVIALFALCWFHLVNSDAGESTQKRAVGGRGGPKRRPRSKSADGDDDVEAPAEESDIVEKEEEGGCRIA